LCLVIFPRYADHARTRSAKSAVHQRIREINNLIEGRIMPKVNRPGWFKPEKQKCTRKFFYQQHETDAVAQSYRGQLNSYKWFLDKGFKRTARGSHPIRAFTARIWNCFLAINFFDKPNTTKFTSGRNTTYEAPLYVSAKLVNKVTGKTKTQACILAMFRS